MGKWIRPVFEAVQRDLNQKRNVELYLTLVILAWLLIVGMTDAGQNSWTISAILAGITLLVFEQLKSRHHEAALVRQMADLKGEINSRKGDYIRVFAKGRSNDFDQVGYMSRARSEIIVIGISLTAFTQQFVEWPPEDFKDIIEDKLGKGVSVYCFLLDPDSELTKLYAADREEGTIPDRINRSKRILTNLGAEYNGKGLKGEFVVACYSHFPYGFIILVDPDEDDGGVIVAHYVHGLKRAQVPIYHVEKSDNPVFVNKYADMARKLKSELSTSKVKSEANLSDVHDQVGG